MRLLPFSEDAYPSTNRYELDLPQMVYQEMVKIAELVAKDKSFLRVDFYYVNGKIYVGEVTFFPAGGMGKFTDEAWDDKLGEWIKLPNNN